MTRHAARSDGGLRLASPTYSFVSYSLLFAGTPIIPLTLTPIPRCLMLCSENPFAFASGSLFSLDKKLAMISVRICPTIPHYLHIYIHVTDIAGSNISTVSDPRLVLPISNIDLTSEIFDLRERPEKF